MYTTIVLQSSLRQRVGHAVVIAQANLPDQDRGVQQTKQDPRESHGHGFESRRANEGKGSFPGVTRLHMIDVTCFVRCTSLMFAV